MRKIHLMELDTLIWQGSEYVVGENLTFSNEEEVDYFLRNSHYEEREYYILPPLMFLGGGVIKKKIAKVAVWND